MQTIPTVSIIVPTYNAAPYIERCIESIINQSFKDIEIIVVDDQSTDNTVELLNSYASQCKEIKILNTEKKQMAGGARNIGIDNARGKFISFIDNDDWVDTDFLYHMTRALSDEDADIAICGVKREYDNARSSCVRYEYNTKNIITGKFAISLLSRVLDQDISISAIVCNKLFRSEFLKEGGYRFFENCYNEDDIFIFTAFLDAKKVSITNETYYHQYQRKNSISRSFNKKHIDDLFFAFKEIKKELSSRNLSQKYKEHYYAFFEKCLRYVLESIRLTEQNENAINTHLAYAYSISRDVIPYSEFIEYCGNKRIESFFINDKLPF